ncbi:MAG: hypothetical protein JNN27_00210 [Planctomycetes bacterium]|nr:hypothetical protein [Planctomycetota bacterium]
MLRALVEVTLRQNAQLERPRAGFDQPARLEVADERGREGRGALHRGKTRGFVVGIEHVVLQRARLALVRADDEHT